VYRIRPLVFADKFIWCTKNLALVQFLLTSLLIQKVGMEIPSGLLLWEMAVGLTLTDSIQLNLFSQTMVGYYI
jgi:hypothetical protein